MNGEITLQYPKVFNINTSLATKPLIGSVGFATPEYQINEDKDLIDLRAKLQMQLYTSHLQSSTPLIFTKTIDRSGSYVSIKNENGQHQFKTITPTQKELNIYLNTDCNVISSENNITNDAWLIIKQ